MNVATAAAATTPIPNGSSNEVHHHDTHALPPAFIQKAHWHYSSVKKAVLDLDEDVIDFRRGLTAQQKNALKHVDTLSASTIQSACENYKEALLGSTDEVEGIEDVKIYEHTDFPGKADLTSVLQHD